MSKDSRAVKAFLVIKSLEVIMVSAASGTYALFILSHGFSLAQLNIVNTVFMVSAFLLDPFTGKLADKWGQRKVYVMGAGFWGLGMFIYFLSKSIPAFMFAEFTAAVGYALMSEAMESWLRNRTTPEAAHRALTKSVWLGRIVAIPVGIAGGYIGAVYGYQYPWLIEAVSAVVLVVISSLMLRNLGEIYASEGQLEVSGIRDSFKEMLSSKPLRLVAIAALISAFAYQPFNMFWSKVFLDASVPAELMGVMWALISLTIAIGSVISGRISTRRSAIAFSLLGVGTVMFVASVSGNFFLVISGFLVHEVFREINKSQLWSYANSHTGNHNRSTANSIRSSMRFVGAASGLLFFALVSENPLLSWLIASIVLILLSFWLTFKLKHAD